MKSQNQHISIQPTSQQTQPRRRNMDLARYAILSRSRAPSEDVTLEGNVYSLDMLGERKPSYQEENYQDKSGFDNQSSQIDLKRAASNHYSQSYKNKNSGSGNSLNFVETPKNLLLPLGSQIWGALSENEGHFGVSPLLSPAEGRLLCSDRSTAEVTPYEGLNDRCWKKQNIRVNKIAKFSNSDESLSGDENIIEVPVNQAQDILRVEENNNTENPVQQLGEIDSVRVNINPVRPHQVSEEQVERNNRNSLRQGEAQQPVRSETQEQPVRTRQQLRERLEAKLYLQKTLPFFLSLALLSGCLFLIAERNYPVESLLTTSGACLVVYAVHSIIRICFAQRERETWRKREEIFDIMDAFCGIIFLLFVQLKTSRLIPVSTMAFLPFIIAISIYCIFSKAPKSTKAKNMLIRSFYLGQVFLITAKVDKIVDWDWGSVFSFVFILAVVMSLYFAAYCLLLVLALIFSLLKHRLFEDMSQVKQYVGLLWHIFSYGLGVIGFVMLIGIQKAFKTNGSFELLKITAIGELVLSGFLVLFTLFAFKPLNRFLEILNRAENSSDNSSRSSPNKEKQIKLEVEKKESYFVMLSSTYFLPMDKNFFMKNEKKIQKIKKAMLSNFLPWKTNSNQTKENEEVKVEALKEYKEALDLKFNKIANKSDKQGPFRGRRSSKPRNPTAKPNIFRLDRAEVLTESNTVKSNQKVHLSADDINIKGLTEESQKTSEEDKTCYLCYSNPPNAVLMKCGHGGICYDCASIMVKKKNECMQCRGPVDVIYKVDPNPKLSDIIKGVEMCKVNFS